MKRFPLGMVGGTVAGLLVTPALLLAGAFVMPTLMREIGFVPAIAACMAGCALLGGVLHSRETQAD